MMKIDGACLCGAYAYEAQIDPAKVIICHCTDCQVNGAAPYRVGVFVAKENYRELRGSLKAFVKTAESGGRRALHFCPECGTSIYGAEPENPTHYSLRIGTARQRAELAPKKQIWRRSALPWLGSVDGLSAHETQPGKLRAKD
jgi:hypothetical protein